MHSPLKHSIRWLCCFLTLILLLWWWRYSPPPSVGGGQPDGFFATRIKKQAYDSIDHREEIGFQRLTTQNANGWYGIFREPIQTFENYQSQNPTRPTALRRTIVLQPLGHFDKAENKLLLQLKEYCEAFFQLPVRIEKPLSIPPTTPWRRSGMPRHAAGNKRFSSRQYNAGKLVDDFLVPRLPDDAAAYLGITMSDLWAGGLSYVFGLGSFEERSGVYSLCRYFPEFWGNDGQPADKAQTLRRACQVLNHEMGHMLGLRHCVLYKCSMNGCNSLMDADSTPLDYCPVCHRKLLWNIGIDGVERYEALLTFYQRHGLSGEAQWTAAQLHKYRELQRNAT